MATRIQVRRGTASEWTSANPTLMLGELGAETDTGRWKIGTGTTAWNSLAYGWDAKVSTILVTTSKSIALSDNFTLQKCLSSSTITITIPLNATVAFPIDSEIVIVRYGSGAVNISATGGVTLYSSQSKLAINNQYEVITLKKIATDEWLLIGSLA